MACGAEVAVVTATARQPLRDAPSETRDNQVLHDVTRQLDNNRLLLHTIKSATMVHNLHPRLSTPETNP